MKTEHKEAIDRARLHGVLPSVLANELMVHDLVNASLFELRNIHTPYSKLNEGQQQEVINRITDTVKDVVSTAVAIISSRNVITIPCKMKQIQVTEKTLTVTSLVDAKDPSRHGLTDSAGHLCLLVLAPDDYADGLDFIQPDRDQADLPLHSSELTGHLFGGPAGADEPEYDDTLSDGTDPLWQEGVQFVVETRRPSISAIQRHLKIGYNRAARMIEGMEQVGIVSSMDTHGAREVLRPVLTGASASTTDALYSAAVEFVITSQRATVSSVQRELKISYDRAAALIEALEKEGVVSPMDHTGDRVVLMQVAPASTEDSDVVDAEFDSGTKEFGEFTYEDAAQLVVLHAKVVDVTWLQRRLAVDSDQATTLLLRMVDNNVIQLETEAEQSIDNTYTVIGDLSATLSLE